MEEFDNESLFTIEEVNTCDVDYEYFETLNIDTEEELSADESATFPWCLRTRPKKQSNELKLNNCEGYSRDANYLEDANSPPTPKNDNGPIEETEKINFSLYIKMGKQLEQINKEIQSYLQDQEFGEDTSLDPDLSRTASKYISDDRIPSPTTQDAFDSSLALNNLTEDNVKLNFPLYISMDKHLKQFNTDIQNYLNTYPSNESAAGKKLYDGVVILNNNNTAQQPTHAHSCDMSEAKFNSPLYRSMGKHFKQFTQDFKNYLEEQINAEESSKVNSEGHQKVTMETSDVSFQPNYHHENSSLMENSSIFTIYKKMGKHLEEFNRDFQNYLEEQLYLNEENSTEQALQDGGSKLSANFKNLTTMDTPTNKENNITVRKCLKNRFGKNFQQLLNTEKNCNHKMTTTSGATNIQTNDVTAMIEANNNSNLSTFNNNIKKHLHEDSPSAYSLNSNLLSIDSNKINIKYEHSMVMDTNELSATLPDVDSRSQIKNYENYSPIREQCKKTFVRLPNCPIKAEKSDTVPNILISNINDDVAISLVATKVLQMEDTYNLQSQVKRIDSEANNYQQLNEPVNSLNKGFENMEVNDSVKIQTNLQIEKTNLNFNQFHPNAHCVQDNSISGLINQRIPNLPTNCIGLVKNSTQNQNSNIKLVNPFIKNEQTYEKISNAQQIITNSEQTLLKMETCETLHQGTQKSIPNTSNNQNSNFMGSVVNSFMHSDQSFPKISNTNNEQIVLKMETCETVNQCIPRSPIMLVKTSENLTSNLHDQPFQKLVNATPLVTNNTNEQLGIKMETCDTINLCPQTSPIILVKNYSQNQNSNFHNQSLGSFINKEQHMPKISNSSSLLTNNDQMVVKMETSATENQCSSKSPVILVQNCLKNPTLINPFNKKELSPQKISNTKPLITNNDQMVLKMNTCETVNQKQPFTCLQNIQPSNSMLIPDGNQNKRSIMLPMFVTVGKQLDPINKNINIIDVKPEENQSIIVTDHSNLTIDIPSKDMPELLTGSTQRVNIPVYVPMDDTSEELNDADPKINPEQKSLLESQRKPNDDGSIRTFNISVQTCGETLTTVLQEEKSNYVKPVLGDTVVKSSFRKNVPNTSGPKPENSVLSKINSKNCIEHRVFAHPPSTVNLQNHLKENKTLCPNNSVPINTTFVSNPKKNEITKEVIDISANDGFKHPSMLSMYQNRRFVCDTCQKGFQKKCNLIAHKRTHTGERPFKCYMCDKSFSESSSVFKHQRVHTGERPYKCEICDRVFKQICNLKKHRNKHNGGRVFKCDICDKCFVRNNHLRQHQVVHSGGQPDPLLVKV